VGDRQPDEGEQAARVVGQRAALHCGDHAGRDADQEPDEDAQDRELERDRDAVDDGGADAQAGAVRHAEVALHRMTEPGRVLHRERLVEPELLDDLGDGLRAAVLAGERQRRAPGQGLQAGEHDHARQEDDDQRRAGPPEEEVAHCRPTSRT
jgi:hypothetical protein